QRLASERARSRRCGTTVRVLVEESRRLRERDPLKRQLGVSRAWFGRSEGEAPEVDGGIYFTGGDAEIGEFAEVRLEGMSSFDFTGRLVQLRSGQAAEVRAV
ncbi:MAG: hypothetical protein WAL67_06860, partial [Candidatus Cybelea sp.]